MRTGQRVDMCVATPVVSSGGQVSVSVSQRPDVGGRATVDNSAAAPQCDVKHSCLVSDYILTSVRVQWRQFL